MALCPLCEGRGSQHGNRCHVCHGRRSISDKAAERWTVMLAEETDCPACKGVGTVRLDEADRHTAGPVAVACAICSGQGRMSRAQAMSLHRHAALVRSGYFWLVVLSGIGFAVYFGITGIGY